MVYVISAEYCYDFIVNVTFNNGIRTDIDLRDTISKDSRPIVRELINIDLFKQVTVKSDTLVWPNGFDLAPEYLYELAKTIQTAYRTYGF